MRQLRKGELASVAGAPRSARGGASSNRFTADELRELFTLDRDTACSTRDVLSPVGPGGRREGGSWAKGGEAGGQQGDDWDDVSAWVVDEPLRRVIDSGVCTFVMEAKEGAKVGAGEEGAREEGERVEGAGRRDGRGEGLGEEEGKGSGNEERGEMEGGDEGARGVVRAVQRDGSAQVEGCKLGMQEAGRGRAAAASADSGGSGANAPVRRLKRVRVAAGVGPDNVELHDSLPASGSAAARADDVDELQLEDW